MTDDIKDALDLITELGGSMAQENCPLTHVLLANGHVTEGEPDKFGRKTIQIPQRKSAQIDIKIKSSGADAPMDTGFLKDIIDKLSGPTPFQADTKIWLTANKYRESVGSRYFHPYIPWADKKITGFTNLQTGKHHTVPCCSWDTDGDGNCPRHPGGGNPCNEITLPWKGQTTGKPPAVRNVVNGPIAGAAVDLVDTVHDEIVIEVDPGDKISLEKIKAKIDEIMKKMGDDWLPQVNTGRFSNSIWNQPYNHIGLDYDQLEFRDMEKDIFFKKYWRRPVKPISFAGEVTIDGTAYPVGTTKSPLNNFADAQSLLKQYWQEATPKLTTTEISFQDFIDHVESSLTRGGLVHFTWETGGSSVIQRRDLEETAVDAATAAALAFYEKSGVPRFIHGDQQEIKISRMLLEQDILISCGQKRVRSQEASITVTIQADHSMVLTKDRTSALGGTKISAVDE